MYPGEESPIVVGFAGGIKDGKTGTFATGKTSTAKALAPNARVTVQGGQDDGVFWDHLYFAMPLYRMANAVGLIEGADRISRIKYEIHQTLIEPFNGSPLYGAPPYDDLVDMVNRISKIPVPKEGKPRTFLQQVGTDICRSYDEDIWVKWMRREIQKRFTLYTSEEEYSLAPYGVVVSDCRFINEVDLIKGYPDHVMIKFVATLDKVRELDEKRGVSTMSAEESQHKSETQLAELDDSVYDAIIDITDMSLTEQVAATKEAIRIKLGV